MSRILQRQELALESVFPAANSGFYIRKGPFSACSTGVHVGLASLLENKLEIAATFFLKICSWIWSNIALSSFSLLSSAALQASRPFCRYARQE
jgi:hypothetical protein